MSGDFIMLAWWTLEQTNALKFITLIQIWTYDVQPPLTEPSPTHSCACWYSVEICCNPQLSSSDRMPEIQPSGSMLAKRMGGYIFGESTKESCLMFCGFNSLPGADEDVGSLNL